jgi:uncharacterized domain HDIG
MDAKKNTILAAIFFVITATVIAYFFPGEGRFRYQFYEGKPWRYGLLTAPQDFPIYKSESVIKAERDSALKNLAPYYKINNDIVAEEIKAIREAQSSYSTQALYSKDFQYIENSLSEIYKRGIISPKMLESLIKDNNSHISVVSSNIAQLHSVKDLFTTKSAYDYVMDNIPYNRNETLIRSCNINNYLKENLTYDEAMTDNMKAELIHSVSIANGMVQVGERIVDRGEIVSNHTYNVLSSLKTVYESKTDGTRNKWIITVGQFLFVFCIMACYWFYISIFRPKLLVDKKSILFLLSCVLTTALITELCITHSLFNIYIIPFAIVPIVVRTFVDSRTALFTHITCLLLCSLIAPFPFEFIVLQMIAGMVVVFSLRDLSQRSQLIRCTFFVFLAYTVCYLSMTIYLEADFQKINWTMLLYFGINFILLMFTYVFIYFLEKTFGYLSSITLVELSNINTPIMNKLSETCPGTFQHSLQVSILGSEAAVRIGANAQMVRTGAMYHDIGKMANPAFFTENQTSVNPHTQLKYEDSAQIIISHVTEGVKMAEKAGLPKEIINFIRSHHGTGLVKYFYNSFKNDYPDKEIDEKLFRYQGPNPSTKEEAILMMADSVEAASRSLKEHTEDNISELVNKIIDTQVEDGLLKMAPLTFRDVEVIKEVFIDKLKTMYHTRISYPELK